MTTRVLTLPGWHGSGPDHWQTAWERLDARTVRVEQANWAAPTPEAWLAALEAALDPLTPTVLAAHSLGCHLVARLHTAPGVVGALLVAPPDLDHPGAAPVRAFTTPRHRLPFPSTLVASSNDPWCSLSRARELAEAWGAAFVEVGDRGHLNSDSRLGTWPQGRRLLADLQRAAPFTLDPRLAHDTHLLGNGPLCELRLFDDARYSWCVLVPRRSGVTEVHQLDAADREQLARESHVLATAMEELFEPDKLNIGALGNVVRQLHVHHVARTLGDPAWPGPVWGHSPRTPRTADERAAVKARLLAHPALAATFQLRSPHGP